MATADSVKANLQNIITKANSTTGRTDSNVDSAVDALIAGFGTGSGGITPTGTISITDNGTYDVTEYKTAEVSVSTPAQKTVVRLVTLNADITGANNTTTILTGDDFIKEHYADEGFFVVAFLETPVASETNVLHFNYHGNKNISSSNVSRTGVAIRSTSASAVNVNFHTAAINGKGYGAHFRVDGNGNLMWYLNSGYILKAGTYRIILVCTT